MPELIVAEALRAVLEAGWKLFVDLKLVSPSFSVRAAVNRYINARLAAVSTYNVATPEATLARATRYCRSGTCTH